LDAPSSLPLISCRFCEHSHLWISNGPPSRRPASLLHASSLVGIAALRPHCPHRQLVFNTFVKILYKCRLLLLFDLCVDAFFCGVWRTPSEETRFEESPSERFAKQLPSTRLHSQPEEDMFLVPCVRPILSLLQPRNTQMGGSACQHDTVQYVCTVCTPM